MLPDGQVSWESAKGIALGLGAGVAIVQLVGREEAVDV
jgi:hypothetical protein